MLFLTMGALREISLLSASSFHLHNCVSSPWLHGWYLPQPLEPFPREHSSFEVCQQPETSVSPSILHWFVLSGGRRADSAGMNREEEGAGGVSRVASLTALPL